MYKAMILLRRKEGASRDAFSQWWLVQHRPLAEQLPNLRRAVFNLVEGDEVSDVDGISELWFDNKADFEAAYQSDIGKSVAADSIANVEGRTRLIVSEHVIKV